MEDSIHSILVAVIAATANTDPSLNIALNLNTIPVSSDNETIAVD